VLVVLRIPSVAGLPDVEHLLLDELAVVDELLHLPLEQVEEVVIEFPDGLPVRGPLVALLLLESIEVTNRETLFCFKQLHSRLLDLFVFDLAR